MPIKKHGIIIETPTEARQAEPGPSILALLVVSVGLAVIVMGAVWFVFFRPRPRSASHNDWRRLGSPKDDLALDITLDQQRRN